VEVSPRRRREYFLVSRHNYRQSLHLCPFQEPSALTENGTEKIKRLRSISRNGSSTLLMEFVGWWSILNYSRSASTDPIDSGC
jgi:hypothetical protein